MSNLRAIEIEDAVSKITVKGTKVEVAMASTWAVVRPSKSGKIAVIIEDDFKDEAAALAWIKANPSGKITAADLSSAQRLAIFPGPGNPQYAAGSQATMTVLQRLGVVNRSNFLSEQGRSIRAELAR